MGKKSSSKKARTVAPENSGVGEGRPSLTPKKAGNEIDDIFAGKKRKKPEKGVEDGGEKADKLKKKKKRDKSKVAKENGFAEAQSKPKKKMADGLTIYTEDELGIGNANAGGTPLCPFDCDCCF